MMTDHPQHTPKLKPLDNGLIVVAGHEDNPIHWSFSAPGETGQEIREWQKHIVRAVNAEAELHEQIQRAEQEAHDGEAQTVEDAMGDLRKRHKAEQEAEIARLRAILRKVSLSGMLTDALSVSVMREAGELEVKEVCYWIHNNETAAWDTQCGREWQTLDPDRCCRNCGRRVEVMSDE